MSPVEKDGPPRAKILVVGLEKDLFESIRPLLARSHFAVERVPRASAAVTLAGHVAFDLVIARKPLPDLSLAELLRGLRSPGCPSANAHVLVLADAGALAEMRAKHPTETVLSVAEPAQLLEQVAARLLGVAPRVATRLLVRLKVQLPDATPLVMCQSENLSEAGLLLRSDRPYPIGTRLSFEAMLPDDRLPIQGEAEVVRHAVAELDGVRGVGARFVALKGDSQDRIRVFVSRNVPKGRAASTPPKPPAVKPTPPTAPAPAPRPAPAHPPAVAPAPAPAPPGVRVFRDRCACPSCQRPFLVVYEAAADESQEAVSVACPHCWHRTQALVADSVVVTREFRTEKVE